MRYRCALTVLLLIATTITAGCGTSPGGVPPSAAPVPKAMETTAPQTAAAEPAAPAAATAQVVIDNFAFSPREITVAPGTRVTWVNRDDVPHTATSSVKPRTFDSGALDTDANFSFVFKAAGTYDYFCAVHPHMTGKVIVK
jgi:plastocyanin